MNSMQRKRIEAGIRALQFAGAEENILPLSNMKEQVLKACELKQNGLNPHAKRKARLRLARRVALATACLLIGVCVYSMLAPVPVSTANSFLSRARVWIGNVLQLDAAIDAPPPSDFISHSVDIPPQTGDFKTIEEVHAAYGLTVYEPTQIPESMKLTKVTANISDGYMSDFSYRYAADEDNMVLFNIQPMPDEAGMTFPEDAIVHTAPAGEFYVWETPSGWWDGVAITGESIVNIKGTLSKDDFLKMLDTLRPVN